MEANEKEKRAIFENVARKVRTPSIYTAWEPTAMDFHSDTETGTPFTQSKIENYYHSGVYADSTLIVVVAAAALICADASSIGALVNYWARRDIERASRKERRALGIPFIKNRAQIEEMLNRLVMYGLCAKYVFRPKSESEGVQAPYESLYLATGSGLRLAKQVWMDFREEATGDPIRNCVQPDDAFAHALRAMALAPFLTSERLKNAFFTKVHTLEKGRFTIESMLRFNPEGSKGLYENDRDVVIEGVTFKTNENVRTLSGKKEVIKKRINGLANFAAEHGTKVAPTNIIFNCEDENGIMDLMQIIHDERPELMNISLFTTGNVLAKSYALQAPENLQDCFVVSELNEQMQYEINGAFGYDFVKSQGGGFGVGF